MQSRAALGCVRAESINPKAPTRVVSSAGSAQPCPEHQAGLCTWLLAARAPGSAGRAGIMARDRAGNGRHRAADGQVPLGLANRDVRPDTEEPGCSLSTLNFCQKPLFPAVTKFTFPYLLCLSRTRGLFSVFLTVLTYPRGSASSLIERPYTSEHLCHLI